jgi:PKD repeat protein
MEDQEQALRNYVGRQRTQRSQQQQGASSNLIIPVVVYVVHNNGPENISDLRVNSQIRALNNAFTGSGIQFCLATQQGGTTFTTPGIIRIQDPFLTNHFTSQESQLKALLPSLPGDRYLRIWVVKDIDNNSGVVGYARFPGTVPVALEGIVMRYDVFGNKQDPTCNCPNLLTNNAEGKVLAHEVGHYLNLYHTFQGGCSGNSSTNCNLTGDYLCDTPQISTADTGCPTLGTVPSCNTGTPALTNNEMDYTNDVCRNSFTTDQQTRMVATLNMIRPLLVSAQNLVYTGVQCAGGLNPAFSADNYNSCTNQGVTFTALNNAGATHAWDFGDGTTGSSSSPATHNYTTAGTYTVTLTVTLGVNSVSSTQQVFVTACAPINSSQGNWYFGSKAGLNFSSGSPVADLNSSMSAVEGCMTQSNAAGSLLFYSDSINVYDKNHTLMNPTTPLMGDKSYTQSSISVPDPGNQSRYYLFTLGASQLNGTPLWYTIVDFSSSPNGIPTNVNTQVSATSVMYLGEQITAVPNCNNTGHWIIVHQRGPDRFVVFSLTSAGISGPVLSNALPGINGSLKASPDGTMLAQSTIYSSGNWLPSAAVYNFDRATGTITLRAQLTHGNYGCSFSPDSKLLYMSEYPPGFNTGLSPVYQYDLFAQNIDLTGVLVASIPSGFGLSMQLGPDKRIYISSENNFLSVINYPNQRNTMTNPNACGYNYNGPSLQGRQSRIGLPNMIDALPPAQIPPDFSYVISSCSTVTFSAPACATSYAWNFGDSATSNSQNPTHIYSANGTYTVQLTLNGNTTVTHTVSIGIPAKATTIFGPSGVCPGIGAPTFYNYSANAQPALTYNWTVTGGMISGVSNSSNVDVDWSTLPGMVQLTVSDPATGCTATKTLTVNQFCQCVIPPAGMVDWWTFDETSGTTAQDLTGSFNNVGTHFNGPTPVAGVVDGALSFDGVNDYVEIANHPEINFLGGCVLDVAEPMTIDMWVKTNLPQILQGANSGLLTLLDKRTSPNQPNGYSIFLFNGRLGFQVNGTNYVAPAAGANYINIADNQWHFVAVSLRMCRGGGGFLYVDGQTVLSLPPGLGFLNTAKLYLGRRDPAFGQNFFKGAMDELEIFKASLSGADLAVIFQAGTRGKCKVNCAGNPSPCRSIPGRLRPPIRR